jgi:hypothetical protein
MYEFISLISGGLSMFIMGGSALMLSITLAMVVMTMVGDAREIKEAPAEVFPMPAEEEEPAGIQLEVHTYVIRDEVPEYVFVHTRPVRDATVMEGEPVMDWRFVLPANKQEAWAMSHLGLALTRRVQVGAVVCVGIALAVALPVLGAIDSLVEAPARIADLEYLQDKQDAQFREDISILTQQAVDDERLIYSLHQRLARLEAQGLPDIVVNEDDGIVVFS